MLLTMMMMRPLPCFCFLVIVQRLPHVTHAWTISERRELFRRFAVAWVAASNTVPVVSASQAMEAANAIISTPLTPTTNTNDEENRGRTEMIRIPLHYVPRLSAYVVYYAVGGERFGAIVDTGSPFLVVPSYCNRQRWGCYRPEDTLPSGLEPTYERFDNNQGCVEWRRGPFSFTEATGSMMGPEMFTFGVLSESLMDGPGGVFLGLIRDVDAWIRPSFLGQTKVRSFQIDLTRQYDDDDNDDDNFKSLTLSTRSGASLRRATLRDDDDDDDDDDNDDDSQGKKLRRNDYIPLVRDLNRRFKDPAYHYTAVAQSMRVNGQPLLTNSRNKIYVILDSGVSGMVVTSDIFQERYAAARANREKSLWGRVEIDLRTKDSGTVVTLTAQRPVTTPLGERPWPQFKNAHLVVVGLAFLENHRMTIDIDQQRLWLD